MWGGACSSQEGRHPAWKRASFSTHMTNIYLKLFVISMCSTWQRILMNLLLHFCQFCSWAFGARISPLYRPLFHPIMFSRSVSILLFLSVPHTRFQPLLPFSLESVFGFLSCMIRLPDWFSSVDLQPYLLTNIMGQMTETESLQDNPP